jgi:hypothetical protein
MIKKLQRHKWCKNQQKDKDSTEANQIKLKFSKEKNSK